MSKKKVFYQKRFVSLKKSIILQYRSSKLNFILLLIFNTISGVNIPIMAIVWKRLIDSLINSLKSNKLDQTLFWLLISAGVSLLNTIILTVCTYLEENQVDKLNIHISNLVIKKISVLPMESYDDPKTYDNIQKVTDNATHNSSSITKVIISIIKSFTAVISSIYIYIYFNIWILVVALIITVPSIIIGLKLSKEKYDIYLSRIEKFRYLGELRTLLTRYENIKEIKVFKLYDFFKDYIERKNSEFYLIDKKIRKNYAISQIVASLFQIIMNVLLKIYVLIHIISYKMSVGDFSFYISTLDTFINSVSSIGYSLVTMYDNILYVDSLFNLLEQEETKKAALKFNPDFKVIELKNVFFKYPNTDTYILKNINLKIEANKSYLLVGLNGSGKSTLIKLLLKIYAPTKGDIFIDGINLNEISIDDYYNYTTAVFQDFIQYPLSVKANIGVGNIDEINNIKLIAEGARFTGIDKLIEELPKKYDTQLNKEWLDGIQLSLGQWQKISISRAIIKKSKLIFFDEPTASIDSKAEAEIFDKLNHISKNKTSIIISHKFSLSKTVDQIIVLQDGYIIEKGNHEELNSKKGIYAELYNLQSKVYDNISRG